jgi:ribosomal protein S18 acetylase RimI-like enzyme
MDGEKIAIVTLGSRDWQEWRTLRLEALRLEPAAFSSTYEESVVQPDEYWQRRLAAEPRLHVMARTAGRAVGMVGAYLGSDDGDPTVAVVFGMYVSRLSRHRGVGRLLLRSLIDRLSTEPDIATIRLWVGEAQLPARRLYESLGFQIVGIEPDPRGDELIMERRVR